MEREIQRPDLWQDKEQAISITQELSELQQELNEFEELKGENDPKILAKKIKEKELQIFLSGRYDKGTAILTIYAGAGGQDAQDWASMLLRMYKRYCQKQGYEIETLHQAAKQVSLEIKGSYAFGFLKGENGVHRLVRISPFSAKSLRHTSFALVEVLPEISKDQEEIKINSEELKIETFRSSGPGGQHVNRRETAVRITHLPTKIVVSCQLQRLQGLNREKAMKLLYAKLYQLKEKEKTKELAQIKAGQQCESISIEWGSQIRSYVLHPYKLVKDLRTDVETSDIDKVLDGDLDQFIEAEIKKR